MFENNPREIKFKIGKKEYDEKVNEFYNLLVKAVDPYTYEYKDVISQQIFWERMILSKDPDNATEKDIQKTYSLSQWDQKKIQLHIHDLSYYDELEFKLYSPDNVNSDFEFMCFAKALVFYLCKLDYLTDYLYRHGNAFNEVALSLIKPPENLNFYKLFIEEHSKDLYNTLCEDYLNRIKIRDKEDFTNIDKDEFLRLLSSHDKANDWMYLTERLRYEDFHKVAIIRETVIKLLNDYYYELIFLYGEEKIIMSEVLAIQKYIEFLNTELKSDASKKIDEVFVDTKEKKKSFKLVEKDGTKLDLINLNERLHRDGIIHKISDKKFISVFKESTNARINFVRGNLEGGFNDVLWFIYFMREQCGFINPEDTYGNQVLNCFLLNHKPLTNSKDSIYSSLNKIRDVYKDGNATIKFKPFSALNNKELSESEKNINNIYSAIQNSIKEK